MYHVECYRLVSKCHRSNNVATIMFRCNHCVPLQRLCSVCTKSARYYDVFTTTKHKLVRRTNVSVRNSLRSYLYTKRKVYIVTYCIYIHIKKYGSTCLLWTEQVQYEQLPKMMQRSVKSLQTTFLCYFNARSNLTFQGAHGVRTNSNWLKLFAHLSFTIS